MQDNCFKFYSKLLKEYNRGDSYSFNFYDYYQTFTDRLSELKFTKLEYGDFRSVWVRGNIVIKIPLSMDGAIDNLMEAKAWKKYRNRKAKLGIYLAPCRILPNCALMMVKVKTKFSRKKTPSWAQMIDNEQIGIYKKRFVCYDYALDIPDRLTWEKEWNITDTFFQTSYLDRRPHLVKGKLPRKGQIIDTVFERRRE